jgi:hypothetical protein
METLPVFMKKSFKARGLLLGERLDLRALGKAERLADAPLAISVRGGGIAVLFRYGAAGCCSTSLLPNKRRFGSRSSR